MDLLTIERMKELKLSELTTEFITRNNLVGLDLNKLDLIEGDAEDFKYDILAKLESKVDLRYTYDERGNPISFSDIYESSWVAVYDKYDNEINCTYNSGTMLNYTYDKNKKILTVEKFYKGVRQLLQIYTYDKQGNELTVRKYIYRERYDCEEPYWWRNRTYDSNGNILTEVSADSRTVYTYDENGYQAVFEIVNNNSKYTTWETYNKKGDKLTFKSSSGNYTESTYDERGNEVTFKSYDIYDGETCCNKKYEYLNDRLYKVYKNDELILTIPEECFEIP